MRGAAKINRTRKCGDPLCRPHWSCEPEAGEGNLMIATFAERLNDAKKHADYLKSWFKEHAPAAIDEQRRGLASVAFVVFALFLIITRLCNSAISIAHDAKLRKSIRSSTLQQSSKLLESMGTAQMIKETEQKVM